jgi:pimeloyl-ACP methyl ester carboxylesterase
MSDERHGVVIDPDGRRIGWMARGPDDGAPVMHLHGWPGSRLEQRAIPAEVLRRFGVRLISVDRPGYGETDPLPGERSVRVRDVLSVCDALEIDRFPVMGVSCGGSNVLTLATIAPDRVTRVLTVSGQMPYDDEAAIAGLDPEQSAELPGLRAGRTPEMEAACAADRTAILADPTGFLGDLSTFSEAERRWVEQDPVRDVLTAEMMEAFRPGFEGYLEDGLVCVKPFDVDVSSIACPVLAVHGTADDWEPLPNLRRVLATIPTTRLITLEGMNHFGPWLFPDLLISLVAGDA